MAYVGEAVRQLAVGVELARDVPRAQARAEPQVDALAAGGALDEGGVELGVVGGEHRPVEASGELGERGAQRRGVAHLAAGEPVDAARADALPRPSEAHERAPLLNHLAAGEHNKAYLQDPVAGGSTPLTS